MQVHPVRGWVAAAAAAPAWRAPHLAPIASIRLQTVQGAAAYRKRGSHAPSQGAAYHYAGLAAAGWLALRR